MANSSRHIAEHLTKGFLTIGDVMGDNIPHNAMKRQVTREFFESHPVFSLDEATSALAAPGGKAGTVERLKYHLHSGRLKSVAREIYAVVPPGLSADRFFPESFLVAVAIRPEGVFSHHSALELLGAAHSIWGQCTLYVDMRRRPLALAGATLRFLDHPKALRSDRDKYFGTRMVERRARMLRSTGPERTLVEGFRQPDLVGGLEELVRSAGGFPTLDLELLEQVLRRYDVRNLWASVGWFLERFRLTFHVDEAYLHRIEPHTPKSPHYMVRRRRGGILSPRWNLIVPHELSRLGESDEP